MKTTPDFFVSHIHSTFLSFSRHVKLCGTQHEDCWPCRFNVYHISMFVLLPGFCHSCESKVAKLSQHCLTCCKSGGFVASRCSRRCPMGFMACPTHRSLWTSTDHLKGIHSRRALGPGTEVGSSLCTCADSHDSSSLKRWRIVSVRCCGTNGRVHFNVAEVRSNVWRSAVSYSTHSGGGAQDICWTFS